MDHMMPKMDGIQTTKMLRDMGYTHCIVALTANALIGQAEMFLQNGFDRFISKPIDSRELNHTLNEFIRNKNPPEVIEAARRKLLEIKLMAIDNIDDNISSSESGKSPLDVAISYDQKIEDAGIKSFFILDAKNAVSVLESLLNDIHDFDDEDISLFITVVHGMKSALANVGEKELSGIAKKLEQAGREKNFSFMSDNTPSFISALKLLITKYKQTNDEEESDAKISTDDIAFLKDNLINFKAACDTIDKKTAKAVLSKLKQKKWPQNIKTALEHIGVHLLHSDFNDAANIAQNTIDVIESPQV